MTLDQALAELSKVTQRLGPDTPSAPIRHAVESVRAQGCPWGLTWGHVADVRWCAKRLLIWGGDPALNRQIDLVASTWSQALLHRTRRNAA